MPQGAKKSASAKLVDPYKREVAERIATAFKLYNARKPRGAEISQGDLGRLVAKRRKLPKPITQAAVSGWMNTDKPSIPDNTTLLAIAEVLQEDPGWLVLGLPREARPEEDAVPAIRSKRA